MLEPLRRVPRGARYALAVVAVGVASAAFAVTFRMGLSLVFRRFFREPDVVEAVRSLPALARVGLPVAGGLAAGLLGVLVSRRPGVHGVAQVMEAVTLGRGRISPTTTLLKALASFLAIVSGGSLGREGPLIQFGGAAGSAAGPLLGLDEKQTRALIAAGTAAGFAAAYNTPIAGVLFVLEIITGLIAFRIVMPVVLTTVLGMLLTRLAIGGPLYGPRSFTLGSSAELVAYGGLGCLAGVGGIGFMRLLRAAEKGFELIPVPRPVRGALGGLGVGLLAVPVPEVTGNGYEVIQQMLDGRFTALMFGVLLLAKALATTSSVSSGSPGGVFTPSLFLGAALGGVVGHAVAALGHPAAAGGYVLVGMAAMIAATTHAPIMASVLGFELSGDYGVVLPLFLATVLATAVSRRLSRDSIYTAELSRHGIPWEGTLAERLARSVRARDILEMDPLTVPDHARVDEALRLLRDSRARVVYVLGPPIRAIDLRRAAQIGAARAADAGPRATTTAAEVAVPVAVVSPDATLLDVSEALWNVDWGELPVVAPDGGLLGIVSRRSVLGALDRELLQRDLLYTRLVSFEGGEESSDYLELPRGQRIEVVAPPTALLGRALDWCRLRDEDGVNVIGVRRITPDSARPTWLESEGVVPGPDDRLMVIGRPDAIQRFRGKKTPAPQ